MKTYYTASGCSNIISISINNSHGSNIATAVIECVSTSKNIGDTIEVYLGYEGDYDRKFSGYVKQIERKAPDDTYTITAFDALIRASDFFIASSNPNAALSYSNIKAEKLVDELLTLAGLTNYTYDATSFTFGVRNSFEVNLVGSLDYIRTICDLLTWSIWADSDGKIHFENRKPYPMTGTSGQPGDSADSPISYTLTDSKIIEINYKITEKDLRNKVVVYGGNDVYATASSSSSYLPAGFYKTAVLAAPMLDTQSFAQDTADYNLDLLNRITKEVQLTVLGDPILDARSVIVLNTTSIPLTGNWYIYACEHNINKSGYVNNLTLRRMD